MDMVERQWRAVCQSIVLDSLGENEYAIYHADYWDSAVLNAVDACLLQALVARSGDLVPEELLVKRVASELCLSPDPSFYRYSHQALLQMAFIGLIQLKAGQIESKIDNLDSIR